MSLPCPKAHPFQTSAIVQCTGRHGSCELHCPGKTAFSPPLLTHPSRMSAITQAYSSRPSGNCRATRLARAWRSRHTCGTRQRCAYRA